MEISNVSPVGHDSRGKILGFDVTWVPLSAILNKKYVAITFTENM